MDKMAVGHGDPVYQQFRRGSDPAARRPSRLALSYEMEPGKDVRYS